MQEWTFRNGQLRFADLCGRLSPRMGRREEKRRKRQTEESAWNCKVQFLCEVFVVVFVLFCVGLVCLFFMLCVLILARGSGRFSSEFD